MAKRHRRNLITASFHFLVKSQQNEPKLAQPTENTFTPDDFKRVLNRISDTNPLDEKSPEVISNIKAGLDLPFSHFEEIETGVYFGQFDGAYYGQKYRNNIHGVISAESLNLRPFNYLITQLKDGKILIGVTYNGQYGDYDGLKNCISHILRGNHTVISRTITSLAHDLRDGTPTELRLTYRNSSPRPERSNIFGTTGVFAIKKSDYGDGFNDEMNRVASNIQGNENERKKILSILVKQGSLIDLDDNDIVGCSAIVRKDGRETTIYFLGGNNMATKFHVNAKLDEDGFPNTTDVKNEMIRIMREKITPIMT